jgi:hypothetical protein
VPTSNTRTRWPGIVALPYGVDLDKVLHCLLHMHHNRSLRVDRDREAECLRLARAAAATWRASRQRRSGELS